MFVLMLHFSGTSGQLQSSLVHRWRSHYPRHFIDLCVVLLSGEGYLLPQCNHDLLWFYAVCIGWPLFFIPDSGEEWAHRDDPVLYHHTIWTLRFHTESCAFHIWHSCVHRNFTSHYVLHHCGHYVRGAHEVLLSRCWSSRPFEEYFTGWTVILFVCGSFISLLTCHDVSVPVRRSV